MSIVSPGKAGNHPEKVRREPDICLRTEILAEADCRPVDGYVVCPAGAGWGVRRDRHANALEPVAQHQTRYPAAAFFAVECRFSLFAGTALDGAGRSGGSEAHQASFVGSDQIP